MVSVQGGPSMTDGERLVWAVSYAIAFDRGGDSIDAVRSATRSILELREAAMQRTADGDLQISQIDERDFVNEMVSAP